MDILNFFDNHTQWFVLGKGSNSLILESALAIPFIKLGSSFQKMTYNNDYLLAKAGALVPQLMSFSQKNGLSGLEFMAGVPASLGGMIAMNFGCWDVCMQEIVTNRTPISNGTWHELFLKYFFIFTNIIVIVLVKNSSNKYFLRHKNFKNY